ncbi:MAG: formate--tetrahydrofolate ligase [Candidatus Omnitrophica bacterium CG1_02_44_16]|nr:MAG: formate--tetrahydrofolate ligase [Candidatus Omnitrophica bacterium CG1_02_44_16]PIY84014.1 MAG: formate--tetrahydrofolate ligase [Candidatus Omnitrophica bacterium CG_4_10_14_0_8_um_filter_44_12]PIZ84958.1 MAG: formate--tetrahydrofolate ligase [Candidatus Omnitrophica bacterium CG_4_10_14_0_2_um_filter_44_9]
MTLKLKDISFVAKSLGIRGSEIEPNGRHKAKIGLNILERLKRRKDSRYILISAITPTALGEGKTVTTIGLSMALNRLKYKSACSLRQSSLGPLFGAKGGATGGGASQVLPQDEVNFHFTGDTHAVGTANNLLVSFLENSIFHANKLGIDPGTLTLKRCLDISDRSLRHIRYFLKANGQKREIETGFEITAASEVMSLVALSRDFGDMRSRLKAMSVARTTHKGLISVKDLEADGMMAAVLKDAIKPNLVQTSENTPCFIHTGPFANVSIGSSSILADRMALGLCDYVVTESGFGADCGGEKFFDIKCRYSGFKPDVCVLVCSLRGLKAQSNKFNVVPGRKIDPAIFKEDIEALSEGAANLKKQIQNVLIFGVPVIVCLNVFERDTAKELEFIAAKAKEFGAADCVESMAWAYGSRGAVELASSVVRYTRARGSNFKFLYEDALSLKGKIEAVASRIYGASGVDYSAQACEGLDIFSSEGFAHLPVCIAKTQFSLSHDESLKGAPSRFRLPINDVRLCSGAGFILAHASTMQTMPGLPIEPRGERIDVKATGEVTGLS